jgi:2'-5' RNA ligase
VLIVKIISGGQTGVDRGALDAALEAGMSAGGWCPRGRKAEDGPIAARYPLRETPSEAYEQRTEWNVIDSDATLLITRGDPSGGTRYTIELAQAHQKPYHIVSLDATAGDALTRVMRWLRESNVGVLNIAGPRASGLPHIYDDARAFIAPLLQQQAMINTGPEPAVTRVFVALALSRAARAKLAAAQADLQDSVDEVTWVAPHNIHLTLAFIGNMAMSQTTTVAETLDQVADHTEGFDLGAASLGWFGRGRTPRVIWAGVDGGPALMELRKRVHQGLVDHGIALDKRPSKPHLTLGRVKSSPKASILTDNIKKHADTVFGRTPVDSLLFLRSRLTPNGPIYSTLHRAVMRG